MPLPPPVTADLHLIRNGRGVQVEVVLAARPPHPLRWSLTADTRAAGGRSHTAQSGTAMGDTPRPVARLGLAPAVQGILSLTVSDAAGVQVQRSCRLGDAPAEALPPC